MVYRKADLGMRQPSRANATTIVKRKPASVMCTPWYPCLNIALTLLARILFARRLSTLCRAWPTNVVAVIMTMYAIESDILRWHIQYEGRRQEGGVKNVSNADMLLYT